MSAAPLLSVAILVRVSVATSRSVIDTSIVAVSMGSSWLGLDDDDFFSTSSRLSSRSSRTRVSLDSTDRSEFGIDGIKIDFGPRNIDFDTSALRSSILREFDRFPRKSGSKVSKTSGFASQSKPKQEDVSPN